VFDQSKKRALPAEAERHQTAPALPIDSLYEPATTWDGLERVGGFGGWWKENWDPEHQFKGFLPSEVLKTPAEITKKLHLAVVEVLASQQAGESLVEISRPEPRRDATVDVQTLAPAVNETTMKAAPTESEEDVAADRSAIDPLPPSSILIESPASEETSQKGRPTESEEDVAADRSPEDPLSGPNASLTYQSLISQLGPAWLQVSLKNPEVKLAVLKRTMQLTGICIPDHVIQSADIVQDLLAQLIKPAKPAKLAAALAEKEDLLTLPNVSIIKRRVTPIDKERRIGGWKVIESELMARDLPVTGH